jgi:cell cycle checkpoint protein
MDNYSQIDVEDCALRGKLENVKVLSSLFKCVQFKDSANFFASPRGLKLLVEDSKCVQLAAFISDEMFEEYSMQGDLIGFKVDLNYLVECLTIFDSPTDNTPTSLSMYYKGEGFPLRLVLIEEDFVTDCSLKTMEKHEYLKFSLPGERAVNKLIAEGPPFKDLFYELDSSSEYVDFFLSPDPPHFRLTTRSTSAKSQITVPKTAEMFKEFKCTATSLTRYKYSQIKTMMKPLQVATQVSLQTDNMGILCVQFMVKADGKNTTYIEYFCTPVIMDEDEGDDDD